VVLGSFCTFSGLFVPRDLSVKVYRRVSMKLYSGPSRPVFRSKKITVVFYELVHITWLAFSEPNMCKMSQDIPLKAMFVQLSNAILPEFMWRSITQAW
jgi:hypothetical protein